jgi:hypothetical protein
MADAKPEIYEGRPLYKPARGSQHVSKIRFQRAVKHVTLLNRLKPQHARIAFPQLVLGKLLGKNKSTSIA